MSGKVKGSDSQITIFRNPRFPGIEVKSGENQFSRHSHIHQSWSFSFVIKGKTLVSLGTGELELEENQFIAVPPGVPHLCSPETESGFSFTVLYIPTEFITIHTSEFSRIRSGELNAETVIDLIGQFYRNENLRDHKTSLDQLRNILDRHSSILFGDRDFDFLDPNTFPIRSEKWGSRFQEYRYARKKFGIGKKKISTIGKMEKAKRLMSENQDLAEIALRCGFYDQSHFSKVFKLYTGLTPAQYLKK